MITPTIPADDFGLDGDRAWWVGPNSNLDADWDASRFRQLDRPCDTCDGHQYVKEINEKTKDNRCLGCIDGQHTWNIQVKRPANVCSACERPRFPWNSQCVCPALPAPDTGFVTFRVSVVPGMGAVPIVSWEQYRRDMSLRGPLIFIDKIGQAWLYRNSSNIRQIALPPGDRPGRFAALLNVERIAS